MIRADLEPAGIICVLNEFAAEYIFCADSQLHVVGGKASFSLPVLVVPLKTEIFRRRSFGLHSSRSDSATLGLCGNTS